ASRVRCFLRRVIPAQPGTIQAARRFSPIGGAAVRRIFRPVGFVLVALYFAVDAVFSYVTRPFVGWIGKLPAFNGIRAWIVSLNAYSALALFAVPVMVLEPVKPVAAYLMATGHLVSGLGSLVGAEILKLTVVERLFALKARFVQTLRGFRQRKALSKVDEPHRNHGLRRINREIDPWPHAAQRGM